MCCSASLIVLAAISSSVPQFSGDGIWKDFCCFLETFLYELYQKDDREHPHVLFTVNTNTLFWSFYKRHQVKESVPTCNRATYLALLCGP